MADRPVKKGTYRFDIRRWPKEVNAPISGIPSLRKNVDAWDAGGAKSSLIYGGERFRFKSLPVQYIRLKVGDSETVKKVEQKDTSINFQVPLDEKNYEVKADMLDARKNIIAGAYYVYCSVQ